MTARLPIPGGDDGDWGSILNDFLEVSLNSDGTLQTSALQQAGGITSVNGQTATNGDVTLTASNVNAVPTSSVGTASGVASLNSNTQVPLNQLGGGTASTSNFLRGDGIWAVPSGAPNATTSTTGVIQLDGDLGGTATSPTVTGIQGNEIATGTPSNGQVLTYSTSMNKWTPTTAPSAPVSSVFGRTGAVVAQNGDYTASQVGALPSTDDLSAISNANATAGNVSMNSHKITNLTSGSSAQDAATFSQIPTTLPPNGSAGGDLSGTYPDPTVARVNGVSVTGMPSTGQTLIASGTAAASWETLQLNQQTVTTKSSSYTLSTSDGVLLANASSGAFTVTLPTAVGNTNLYNIKKIDNSANNVTVATSNGQTIDGGSTAVIKVQYVGISVVSDGSNWYII